MFKSTYYLLKIFDQVNRINGRKKLQKLVYLIEASGTHLPFSYQYHHYGPYSSQLQQEISFMVQQDFLTELKEDEAYIYEITRRGREFMDRIEEDYNFDIDGDLVSALNEENSQLLEMVSTYAFLLQSGYNSQSAKNKAIELKPHLAYLVDKSIGYFNENIAGR